MRSEYDSFPSLNDIARTALPHHSPRYTTNQATDRIEAHSFSDQTAAAAHRFDNLLFVLEDEI
jgi:hypothetical protein